MNREQGTGNRERQHPPAPMRRPVFGIAVLLCCSLFPVPCSLRAAEPPHIEKFQVGLPGGKGELDSPPYRSGAWAPVYVKINAGPDGNGLGQFTIRVETTDSEGAVFHYETPLPALDPRQDFIAVSYTRPGNGGSEVAVSLVAADGQVVPAGPAAAPSADKQALGAAQPLYLSVGSRLARGVAADLEPDDHKGTVPFAYIDDIATMPDRWFGYDAADVVVLTSGSQSFVESLLHDGSAPQRRKALAEWVRRGGQLIVSVGAANRQNAAKVLDEMQKSGDGLIDCRIDGKVACPETTSLARWLAPNGRATPLDNLEITRLQPGAGVTVLVSESCKEGDKTVDCPVVVESSCGLGRVWLTAFDLDEGPFAARDWAEGRKAFWSRVQAEFIPKPAAVAPPNPNGFGANEPPALLAEMQRSLEDFETVPVVSFGWVALFILIYIVIVGPLDYILLTRVFKRPELTWITFPVVVLSLSVLVYVVAYSMKGDDLRVNKIDLVEYDLAAPQQAYGTTWFTLFSPRIQNYTVGVEPSAPGWASPPTEGSADHAVTVATLANPAQADAAGSPSLFRKPYAYAEDASGLERRADPRLVHPLLPGVVARRRRSRPSARPERRCRQKEPGPRPPRRERPEQAHRYDPQQPARAIAECDDLLSGKLLPGPGPGARWGVPRAGPVGAEARQRADRPARRWLGGRRTRPGAAQPGRRRSRGASGAARTYVPVKSRCELMKDLMFHAKATASTMTNGGLRSFDQSWRLDEKRTATPDQARDVQVYRDEIILVARTPTLSDRADAASQNPGSATRLWIDRLPDGKSKPPALPGYLWQETYVRVYIPVQHPQPDDRAVKP